MVFTHRSRMLPWHLDVTSSQNFLLFDRWSPFFFFGLMFTSSHQQITQPLTARAPSSSRNFTQSHDRFVTTYCFSLSRTHLTEKDFAKFVKIEAKIDGDDRERANGTVSFMMSLHVSVLAVYRSVTFRRFSRHVVAYETLSAWSSREREPTRLVCL